MGAVYDDLDTFYLARPARCDDVNNASYGRWHDERGEYDVRWACATGELYAEALTARRDAVEMGHVEVLGVIAPIAPEHRTSDWHGAKHVDNVVLKGWQEANNDRRLAWLRDRVARVDELLGRRLVISPPGGSPLVGIEDVLPPGRLPEDFGAVEHVAYQQALDFLDQLEAAGDELVALGASEPELGGDGASVQLQLPDDDDRLRAVLELVDAAIERAGLPEPSRRYVWRPGAS